MNSLYDEISIGKARLRVKTKAITLYTNGAARLFLRKIGRVKDGTVFDRVHGGKSIGRIGEDGKLYDKQ